jgi:hypothetical protein
MNHHQNGKSLKGNSRRGLFNKIRVQHEIIIRENVQANR